MKSITATTVQWNNTTRVINWFKTIENKNIYKFMTFDIKDFYSSKNKKLLHDSVNFTRQHVQKRRFQYYPTRKKITPLPQENSVAKEKHHFFDVAIRAYNRVKFVKLWVFFF